MFLYFERLASNTNKKSLKNLLATSRNKFSKVFIQNPGTYKKTSRSYGHTNKSSK